MTSRGAKNRPELKLGPTPCRVECTSVHNVMASCQSEARNRPRGESKGSFLGGRDPRPRRGHAGMRSQVKDASVGSLNESIYVYCVRGGLPHAPTASHAPTTPTWSCTPCLALPCMGRCLECHMARRERKRERIPLFAPL